jgi:hypothetical protein
VPAVALWPAIRYTASVSVHGIPAVGDPVAAPVSVGVGFWAMPWPQLLALIALAALIWLRIRWRGWRQRKAAAVTPPPSPAPAPSGEPVPQPQPTGAS